MTSNTPSSPFAWQFSIRTLLITMGVSAAVLVALTKLFFSHYQLFIAVLGFCSTVLPFLLAIAMLFHIGRAERRPRVTAWACGLGLAPLIGGGLIGLLTMLGGPGSNGLAWHSNRRLIRDTLPEQIEDPPVWRELERRAKTGKLSTQEVDTIAEVFASYLTKRSPSGSREPLHWQQGFLEQANASGIMSADARQQLCAAFFGKTPEVEVTSGPDGGPLRFTVHFGTPWDDDNHHGIGLRQLWYLRQATVDGQPLKLDDDQRGSDHRRRYTSSDDVSAEAQALTLELEVAYVLERNLLGLRTHDMKRGQWPAAASTATRRVEVPLNAPAAPPREFQLLTDPARAPTGQVTVDRLAVQVNGDGQQFVVLHLKTGQRPTCAISVDVLLDFDQQEHQLGGMWVAPYGNNGMMSSGTQLQLQVPVDGLVKAADVVLRPNADHIRAGLRDNRRAETDDIKSIWGKTIRMSQVPLERLDLEWAKSKDAAE